MATSFKFIVFASAAGGQRTCPGAAFSALKKFATHFFNPDFVGTAEKETPYAGTGEIFGSLKI